MPPAAKPKTTAVVPAPRQQLEIKTVSEVMELAQILYRGGMQPRGVARAETIAYMILTGMEAGLGPMASLECVTPPVNGKCSLYGDAALALIRASGLLAKLEERVEGYGDDREGVCVIQRTGWPEREFRYTMKLAKTLKSFPTPGGQWQTDPDNMLQWRARWRAARTEFTDVLKGLSIAEDQDEFITVTASPATPKPAKEEIPDAEVVASVPVAPTPADPTPASRDDDPPVYKATSDQLSEIVRIKGLFDVQHTDPAENASRWKAALQPFGVASARDLTDGQAEMFIVNLGSVYDPFTYPPASKSAA